MAGDPTLGVCAPLPDLTGTFCDDRLNTPPDPVCCADFAFAALEINSDIMPLLVVSVWRWGSDFKLEVGG